jgi:hypothetical protein
VAEFLAQWCLGVRAVIDLLLIIQVDPRPGEQKKLEGLK